MAAGVYGKALQKAVTDFVAPGLKAMICDATYVPDFDAHEFRSSVTGEVTGTGYTAGGVALTGEAVTIDAATNRVKLDADDVDFGTVTFTAGTQVIVYVNSGAAATDRLVSRHTFTEAQSPSGTPFFVTLDADGIAYGTYG